MAIEKETIILDFQVEQGDAISELEKTKKSIIGLKKEQQELNKAYKEGNVDIDEYASESVRLEGILKKQTNTYNTLQKSTAGVVTQFDKLIKANEQIGKNVGKQNEQFKEFAANVNVGGASVGDLTGKLSAFINPATAAAGAVGALAGLYLSSAAGAKDLESAQIQLSTSFQTIGNDLAEIVGADGKGDGLLSKFAFQLNRAFFGINSAIRGQFAAGANQALKELEVQELNAKQVAKIALQEAEKLRRVRDDDTKSFEVRKNAAEAALNFINVREQVLVDQQKNKLTQLKILLSLNKDDLNLQREIKAVEFEISDIREDSEGKRTELLTGVNNLQNQQNAILAEELRLKKDLVTVTDRLNESSEREIEVILPKVKGKLDENAAIEVVNNANKKQAAFTANYVANEERKQAATEATIGTFGQLATTIALLAGRNKDLALAGIALERATAISQIVSNTGIANAKAIAATPLTFGQPFVGINTVSAALSIATVLAQAVQSFGEVSKAAGGGKFMTKGPTLLMVGDNPGGVERVTVEPISGRGKTVVNGNLAKMAGGGVLETQSVTGPINAAMAFRSTLDRQPIIYASWKEATELNTRVQFKESLVTV